MLPTVRELRIAFRIASRPEQDDETIAAAIGADADTVEHVRSVMDVGRRRLKGKGS